MLYFHWFVDGDYLDEPSSEERDGERTVAIDHAEADASQEVGANRSPPVDSKEIADLSVEIVRLGPQILGLQEWILQWQEYMVRLWAEGFKNYLAARNHDYLEALEFA